MTKIYLGNALYEIHIGHQKITLSEDELAELNEEILEELGQVNKELEELIEENEELNEKLEEKDKEILTLMEQLMEAQNENG